MAVKAVDTVSIFGRAELEQDATLREHEFIPGKRGQALRTNDEKVEYTLGLGADWTIHLFRRARGESSWKQIILDSTGNLTVDGVREPDYNTDWVTVQAGNLVFSKEAFDLDELLVVPRVISSEERLSWTSLGGAFHDPTQIIQGTTIADGAITTRHIRAGSITAESGIIADAAITSAKIASAAITTAKISDSAITSAKIANATIQTADIGNAQITTALIANAAIKTALIDDLQVTTGKIADAAILTAKIADAQITTAKIADAAITNAKINDLSADKITTGFIDAARIAAGSITADKLAAGAVTADAIDAGAVTADKLAANSVSADKIYGGTLRLTGDMEIIGPEGGWRADPNGIVVRDQSQNEVVAFGDLAGKPWGSSTYQLPPNTYGFWGPKDALYLQGYPKIIFRNSFDVALVYEGPIAAGEYVGYLFDPAHIDLTPLIGTVHVPPGRRLRGSVSVASVSTDDSGAPFVLREWYVTLYARKADSMTWSNSRAWTNGTWVEWRLEANAAPYAVRYTLGDVTVYFGVEVEIYEIDA